MSEIYWLQRLGNVAVVFNVGFFVCACVVIIAGAVMLIEYSMGDIDEETMPKIKRIAKKFLCVFAFFTIGAMFLPTTKELYAIYGLGGVIDYIKSNDKAKQLPDKCIDALTRYVDSIEKENKKDSNN